MVKTRTLQLAAMYGGVIVLGTGIGLMEKLQYDMRKTEFYQKSLVLLRGYKPAIEMLGEPLEVKRLDLAGRGPNKVDQVKGWAKLEIPLQGSQLSGTLFSWSTRDKPTNTWEIDKLEIIIESKGKWKFYERQRSDSEEDSGESGAVDIIDSDLLYLKSR